MSCTHENDIQYLDTVYKDDLTLVQLVSCSDCGAQGAQYQRWDEVNNDYYPQSEAWHRNIAEVS